MAGITRRDLIKTAVYGAAAWTLNPAAKVLGANDEIRLGVIGFRSRGKDLLNAFSRIPGVTIAGLCDADEQILRREQRVFPNAFATTDLRKLLERKDIDAVAIATPNHWHALAAVWAMQAGKHVYLEKPVCHSIWEGTKLIEAERKYGKIVAAGFQNRSDTGLMPFMADLHSGMYGKVTHIRGLCYRDRVGIGARQTPLSAPWGLDTDLWSGPAHMARVFRDSWHYDWHWMWEFGNGDVGNQGPHEMDLIRWALGDPMNLPQTVVSSGRRFVWNDAGETPNVLVTHFNYNGVPVMFEVNDLIVNKRPLNYQGITVGVIITCEGGEFRGGRGGGRMYDPQSKEIKHYPGDSGGTHYKNFIEALQAGDSSKLRSPLASAVYSSDLSHLANISYHMEHRLTSYPAILQRDYQDNELMREAIDRNGAHVRNAERENVPDRVPMQWYVGRSLEFDSNAMNFPGDPYQVNRYLKRDYRPGYVLPENV